MIDFRYHLVSIASVFLALAVGIVLGAGPLKGTISDTLTSEVTKLREDANSLRADVNTAESAVQARDDLITQLRPRSVARSLSGERVAILALPDTADSSIERARTVLDEAGALPGPTVQVQASWASQEPPDVTDRAAAAAELRALLAGELPVGIAPEQVLALGLSNALTGADLDPDAQADPDPQDEPGTAPTDSPTEPAEGDAPTGEPTDESGDESPSTEQTPSDGAPGEGLATEDPTESGSVRPRASTSAQVLEILTQHGLIRLDGEETLGTSSAIVALAPAKEADEARIAGWVDLVSAVGDPGALLIAGEVPADASVENNVIAAVRDVGDLSRTVSSLDNLDTAVGLTALPLALAGELDGVSGHFGVLDTASTLFPAVPVSGP